MKWEILGMANMRSGILEDNGDLQNGNENSIIASCVQDRSYTPCLRALTRSRASHLHFSNMCLASVLRAVGNLKQPVLPYHPSTKSSSISHSQLYVKKTHTLDQYLTMSQIAQRKGVPLIRSPHHTPVPPSPPHHFLAALGYRSQ
jgi:hypothetical protein